MNQSEILIPESSIDEGEIEECFKERLRTAGITTVKEAVSLPISSLMPMMDDMGWHSTLRDLEILTDLRLMCARY